MKWFLSASLFFLLVFIFPFGLMAESYLSEADTLYDRGDREL
jgi:hypothetical protein